MNHNEYYPVNHVSKNLKLMSESNSTGLRVYDSDVNEPPIDLTSIKPNVTPPKVTSPSEDKSTIISDGNISERIAAYGQTDDSLYIPLIARISIDAVEGIEDSGPNGEGGTDVRLTKGNEAWVEHKVHHWHVEILN